MPRRKDGFIRQQFSTTQATGVLSDIIAKQLTYQQIADKWHIPQSAEILFKFGEMPMYHIEAYRSIQIA